MIPTLTFTMLPIMAKACSATTEQGGFCHMPAMRGKDGCYVHTDDPTIVARRHVARKLGGRHRRRYLSAKFSGPRLNSMAEVRDIALATFNGMRNGTLPIEESIVMLFGCHVCGALDRAANPGATAPGVDGTAGPGEIKPTDGLPDFNFPLDFAAKVVGELANNARKRGVRPNEYLRLLREYSVRQLDAARRRLHNARIDEQRAAQRKRNEYPDGLADRGIILPRL